MDIARRGVVHRSFSVGQKALIVLLFCAFFGVACHASAQDRSLTGTVEDPSGAFVAGSKVVVENENSGLVWTVTSDGDGNFSVPHLPPGTYTITVRSPGFYKTVKNGVKIASAIPSPLEIRLDLSRAPNYLTRIKKPFGMEIERVAHSQFERALLDKAEHVPCRGGEWANQERTAVRWPRCLNRNTVDYYVKLLKRYERGDFRPSHSITKRARAFFHASVSEQSAKHEWKVELVLEYADYCGSMCGQGFEIIRTIYFDKDMKIIKIEGDDEGAHGWIS